MLLGCYRTGEAADPEIYLAAVIDVLSNYSFEVMLQAIDPNRGLPAKIKWLPNVAEIKEECERIVAPEREREERRKQLAQQLAERAQYERERGQSQPVADTEPRGEIYDMHEFHEALAKHGRPFGAFEKDRQLPYRG
jgi:hypothetical protein